MTNLEIRMLNIVRKNPITNPKAQYKAALNRLVKAGLVSKGQSIYTLSTAYKVRLQA
jgi:hypothetical protein